MQLEDYFDFLAPDDIRIKGHRIGIETVLTQYLHRDKCTEEIQRLFPTLTLEEVHATILYYLHNQEQVGRYVADWLEWSHQARREAQANPSPAAQRLHRLRNEINAYPPKECEAALQRIIARQHAAQGQTPDTTSAEDA